MLIQQLLNTKAGGVLTIAPSETVAAAAEVLAAKRIGALIVSGDGSDVLGVISERDIVREIGRRGAVILEEAVSALMTAKVTGCVVTDSVDDVMRRMTDGRFRHMPVMEGDRMIGVISIGDVVKAQVAELAMEKDALEGMIKGY
ncbi:CBS domain-containing protein [Falsirhodobacter xinxiangensis]|uniref:CBS domain-containing protein n=1 Tax=Falsirhodobacter xinxiangensis TaxID=2530049 RepID=UPI0010AADAE5|nr:CBS domain-containing protein [Rhodobacter xinxiangensis]